VGRTRILVAAALLAVVAAGCGGPDGEAALTPLESEALVRRLGDVRDAARSGDRRDARDRLQTLEAEVRRLAGAGRLDSERSEAILREARGARKVLTTAARRSRSSPTPTPTPTPTATATASPRPTVTPGKVTRPQKGKGKGKKGRSFDDGDEDDE